MSKSGKEHKLKHMNPEIKEQEITKQKYKKYKWLAAITAVVVIVLIGGFILIKGFQTKPRIIPSLPSPAAQAAPTIQAQITITAKGFIPTTLLVKKGTEVSWVSKDNKLHQIASDPHPLHNLLPELYQQKPSTNFSYIFTKTGTFSYHDEKNPLKLKGTIIVR